MGKEKRYCIIKELILQNGKIQNVIILDGGSEVLEFSKRHDAEYMAQVFESNSDSGYKYRVREI